MDHEELKNALSAYSLGALDPEERESLEQHLSDGCPECQALLSDLRGVAALLPHSVPAEEPPAHLKEKIMGGIEPRAVSHPSTQNVAPAGEESSMTGPSGALLLRWKRISWGLAAAVGIAMIALFWSAEKMRTAIRDLEAQVRGQEQLVAQLRIRLAERERILRIVQAPEVLMVNLKGLPVSPQSNGKVLFNPKEQKALFYGFGLPQPPSDKDYQLWYLLDGTQPMDAGLFSVNPDGSATALVENIAEVKRVGAFAVTLEPKGGSVNPTIDRIYLVGSVTKS